jgi:hypothetical protein
MNYTSKFVYSNCINHGKLILVTKTKERRVYNVDHNKDLSLLSSAMNPGLAFGISDLDMALYFIEQIV